MKLTQTVCRFLFFKVMRWKEDVSISHRDKCIICVAPHTSNFDFILAELYYTAIGRHANFLMKKEWFFWPLGLVFRRMGGIAVERGRRNHLTEQLAQLARNASHFELAVTPEGTRSLTDTWKRGFYFIAQKADLPIQLYAIDYSTKTISCHKEIYPSQNVESDMVEIMRYYENFKGRHPERFTIEPIGD